MCLGFERLQGLIHAFLKGDNHQLPVSKKPNVLRVNVLASLHLAQGREAVTSSPMGSQMARACIGPALRGTAAEQRPDGRLKRAILVTRAVRALHPRWDFQTIFHT